MSLRYRRVMSSYKKAVAGGWWLSGGISAANCLAAYQAYGASSQADSYKNLANPGTYDLTLGNGTLAWATDTGWVFDDDDERLDTGITIPSASSSTVPYTVIIWLKVESSGGLNFGKAFSNGNDNGFSLIPFATQITPDGPEYKNGGVLKPGGALGTYIYTIAGNTGYLDGVSEGSIATGDVTAGELFIGNRSDNKLGLDGEIYVVSVYNTVLNQTQVQAVGTAINAL